VIDLPRPIEVRLVVLKAPPDPKDWSAELDVAYERAAGAGMDADADADANADADAVVGSNPASDDMRGTGVDIHVAPRTVISFDPTLGPISRIRITNRHPGGPYHWSIHEIEIWTPADDGVVETNDESTQG
jgi:hypothetical protein